MMSPRFALPVAVAALLLSAGVSAAMDFGPFGWFRMASGSMEPTMSEGDIVTSDRPKFLCNESDVKPGDVVLYHRSGNTKTVFIHRAVAGPGSTVAMRDDALIIDGHPVARTVLGPTKFYDMDATLVRETLPNGVTYKTLSFGPGQGLYRNFGPKRVPAGAWFILGDNRDDALDSRANGFVPLTRICAVAQSIVGSEHPDRVGQRP